MTGTGMSRDEVGVCSSLVCLPAVLPCVLVLVLVQAQHVLYATVGGGGVVVRNFVVDVRGNVCLLPLVLVFLVSYKLC